MFSIENDIVYSIEYVDRSNWLAKKNPVMDKATFVECFKRWITPGTKTEEKREHAELAIENYKFIKCNNCNYSTMLKYDYCPELRHDYCPKCGERLKEWRNA